MRRLAARYGPSIALLVAGWVLFRAGVPPRPGGCPHPQVLADALVQASRDGDADGARRLLARGANVNARGLHFGYGSYASTPLIAAVGSGNRQLVRLLLAHGADVNLRDENGHTAL